jgi:Ca2+-binding EF-hand superfamily protein
MMSCLSDAEEGVSQMDESDVAELIDSLDTSGDGTLELSEFVLMMALLTNQIGHSVITETVMPALRAE